MSNIVRTPETVVPAAAPETSAPAGDDVASRSRRPRRRLRSLSRALLPLALLPVILGLWQLAAAHEWVNPLLLPLPADVWAAMERGVGEGLWTADIRTTLTETVLGFAIGVTVGLVMGAVFAFVEPVRTALYPYVLALMSMPKIAIAPLLIVALGYDMTPKIVIAALLAFFPVLVSAAAGLAEVNPDELNLMRAIGASRRHELRYLRLPNAMSYVFPSLDVALISALLGAVAAELVGSKTGIGHQLSQAQAYGDVPSMYGLLLILVAIGALLRGVVIVVHRLLPMSVVPK